jgi:hypothetical protein
MQAVRVGVDVGGLGVRLEVGVSVGRRGVCVGVLVGVGVAFAVTVREGTGESITLKSVGILWDTCMLATPQAGKRSATKLAATRNFHTLAVYHKIFLAWVN